MPAALDYETKCFILHLGPLEKSVSKILERLKNLGKNVGGSTVYKLLEEQNKKLQGWTKPPRRLPEHMRPSVRTKAAIAKVRRLIRKKNPPCKLAIADKTSMSPRSVGRILKENLVAKQLKKCLIHALTAKQAEQPYVRGRRFRKFLSRRKLKFLFTMDEMML